MSHTRQIAFVLVSSCAAYLFMASDPRAVSAVVTSEARTATQPESADATLRYGFGENVAASMVAAALWAVADAVANSLLSQGSDEGSMDGLTGFKRGGVYLPESALDPRCEGCAPVTE